MPNYCSIITQYSALKGLKEKGQEKGQEKGKATDNGTN